MTEDRIVFMGTPEFAVAVLDRMIEEGKNVVGVITAPDKPSGRGQRVSTSAVKDYAVAQGLNLLQPTNLKDKEFLKDLQNLEADVQVVVAFRMLPKVVWQMPKKGTFNLHASLLPDYRGAAPINWAIINGEAKTGVTTFFIDEKIDTGAIISKKEVQIEPGETAGSLHEKLKNYGADLVISTLDLIKNNKAESQAQPIKENIKEAPKLSPENTKIDWTRPGKEIDAFIRGLTPYPVAWTYLHNQGKEEKMKIYAAEFEDIEHHFEPGKIIVGNKRILKVACQDGYLELKQLQLPGKRKMDSVSLLNGYSFSEDAKVS